MRTDRLFPHEIYPLLQTTCFGKRIHHFETVGSTNDIAQQLAMEGAPEGTLVLAEEQSKGRGRLGRSWTSERSAGIYASLVLRPRLEPKEAPILNLAAAVAVSQAIQEIAKLVPDIKWPNDVLVNGRKCCGILTEMNAEHEKVRFVILGMGINVSQQYFPSELKDRASSLSSEAKMEISRLHLLVAVLRHLEVIYQELHQQGRSWVVNQWNQHSSFAWGKQVTVESGNRRLSGITMGLGEDGTLRVKMASGQIETVMSGDLVAWESTANVTCH
ncbi:MAG: biotin--[acetyl-CoA-carboxylase] ligase [Terriglobia bacterium]